MRGPIHDPFLSVSGPEEGMPTVVGAEEATAPHSLRKGTGPGPPPADPKSRASTRMERSALERIPPSVASLDFPRPSELASHTSPVGRPENPTSPQGRNEEAMRRIEAQPEFRPSQVLAETSEFTQPVPPAASKTIEVQPDREPIPMPLSPPAELSPDAFSGKTDFALPARSPEATATLRPPPPVISEPQQPERAAPRLVIGNLTVEVAAPPAPAPAARRRHRAAAPVASPLGSSPTAPFGLGQR